jgi:hypothetical protein
MKSDEDIAKTFLLRGIQQWGQSPADREQATREYVTAAGFVFGSDDGNEWLRHILQNLKRGKLETEIEQLVAALASRASILKAARAQ